jgi:hypothetical protein
LTGRCRSKRSWILVFDSRDAFQGLYIEIPASTCSGRSRSSAAGEPASRGRRRTSTSRRGTCQAPVRVGDGPVGLSTCGL